MHDVLTISSLKIAKVNLRKEIYLITLEGEYVAVWKRKIYMTSLLLLSVRWAMVATVVVQAWIVTPGVRLS